MQGDVERYSVSRQEVVSGRCPRILAREQEAVRGGLVMREEGRKGVPLRTGAISRQVLKIVLGQITVKQNLGKARRRLR